ncbi:rhomboid family intramembrane serine protease [Allohahella sp. A8]|uniref:rhomboid family intramembrane serine protease n=1 Tax=Allohahella sp. A8 TaxID=3141461 RepID=UPI000C0B570E|nr:hypothetical protein [Hahellaceae bacterium]|tara:strand:+ start:100278 stop:101213 length:936 start_codon:yes stop_codon:yes gene_type:complete
MLMLMPYRIDARKRGLPLITVLICLISGVVFWEQVESERQYRASIESFCSSALDDHAISILQTITHDKRQRPCFSFFNPIREASDPEAAMAELVAQAEPLDIFVSPIDGQAYIASVLRDSYEYYDRAIPELLTDKLAYDPKDLDWTRMITATFSHGDLGHLLGNLLFFYIFAASVELLMGTLTFAVFISVATIGTSLAYSFTVMHLETALPTVGLSGVVMACLVALALMMPGARIRHLLWIILYFRVIRIPAFFLMLWYVGWDIYDMRRLGNDSLINYAAHLGGALIGGLIGAYYAFFRRDLLDRARVHYS